MACSILWLLDFETKSGTGIKRGHDNYFQDPEADILCMAYGPLEAREPFDWWPGMAAPTALFDHVNAGGLIGASNAAFDRSAWEYLCVELYGFPAIRLNQWYCTQAQARTGGLPSKLDDCARALGLRQRKDRRGGELIKKMCIKPFEHTPELLAEMVDYCRQDWRVMRDAVNATPLLSARHHEDYVINERINERGVKIDLELAKAASQYAEQERAELSEDLELVTGGVMTKPTQYLRFTKWLLAGLEENGCEAAAKMMVRYKWDKKKKESIKKYSSDRAVRTNMLSDPVTLGIPQKYVEGLQIMDDASGAATAKYAAMVKLAGPDGRVRGAIRAFGAPATLRFSSMRLQVHNFRRDSFKLEKFLALRAQVIAGAPLTDPETGEPLRAIDTLGTMIKGAIIAEDGYVLIDGDWSAAQSRLCAWLCREETKIDLFARGESPYCNLAEGIYGYPVNKKDHPKEYQVGKVGDLALGFLGGKGALASMAAQKGLYIPEDERQSIVDVWRGRHPKTVEFGNLLSSQALAAMRDVGVWKQVSDRGAYFFDGSALYAKLPDGQTLIRYPEARVEMVVPPWNKDEKGAVIDPEKPKIPSLTALASSKTMAADAEEWPRHALWRGLLINNFVQGMEAIMLRDTADIFVDFCIFHVHDSLALEVLRTQAEEIAEWLQCEMERPPEWAPDLLLVAEPEIVERYGT